MSKETGNEPESYSSLVAKLRFRAGLLAGVAAIAGAEVIIPSQTASAGSRDTHQLEEVGIATNQIWVTDLDQARQAAQEIADTGANTVKIYEPISPGQAEIKNDRERLCNAAEAAEEKSLTLEIGYVGHNGDRHAYLPASSSAVTRFDTTVTKILWSIAGPNANKPAGNGDPACVSQPLKKVGMVIGNEVNSKYFNASSDPAGDYAYLLSRAYPALKSAEAAINQEFAAAGQPPLDLEVAAGGYTATQDALGFQIKVDKDLKALGLNSFPADRLALHPYAKDPRGNPADIMASLYEPIEQEFVTQWGEKIPILYDEFGNFAISAAKRYLYGSKSLGAPLISDGLQGDYLRDALLEASAEPEVVGALNFQGADDPNDGSPTGIDSPDGSHKASWNKFAMTVHQVLPPKS